MSWHIPLHVARILLVGLLLMVSVSLNADPLSHAATVMYPAYQGDPEGNPRIWSGYQGASSGSPAYAGTLTIIPGNDWENFITAAQQSVPYSIAEASLVKTAPGSSRCPDALPAHSLVQENPWSIRLQWPLIYEAPGTVWTLTISYTTDIEWDDDGPDGPNAPSYTHTERWEWTLGSDIAHLRQLVTLFHDMAFGKSSVPLLSDETAYSGLMDMLQNAIAAEAGGDYPGARGFLEQFQTAVSQGCIVEPPVYPMPQGPGTGIAGTPENPACCKLMADVDYILGQPPYAGVSAAPPQAAGKSAPAVSAAKNDGDTRGTYLNMHDPEFMDSAFTGDSGGNPVAYCGFDGVQAGPVSFPGVLGIDSGSNWANFVAAAQDGVAYSVKNVVLTKQGPRPGVCDDVFTESLINQQGSTNIRRWWPLMYETAGTTWTLNITYGTSQPYDGDGDGITSYMHTEVWQWMLGSRLGSLESELRLFHSLPFGTCEVPLISDEMLYPILEYYLYAAADALMSWDDFTAGAILADMASEIDLAPIVTCPTEAQPSGPGTGVAATMENPTVCKLLTDIGYCRLDLGISYAPGGFAMTHAPEYIYAVYSGDLDGTTRVFSGHNPLPSGFAVQPGTLYIESDGIEWPNFVAAAAAEEPYMLWGGAVALQVTAPQTTRCAGMFSDQRILQLGYPNIRQNWPLLYCTPGTTWTLNLTYATPTRWDPDGPGGFLDASYLHSECWTWQVDANLESVRQRLALYRDLPVGARGVTILSDETLYVELISMLDDIEDFLAVGAIESAAMALADFEMVVADACIYQPPIYPSPGGAGTGILNTYENPAGCALLVDMEYIAMTLGLVQPAKQAVPIPQLQRATSKVAPAPSRVTSGEGGSIVHSSIALAPASTAYSLFPNVFRGYSGMGWRDVAFPGVLGISPGTDWANFVSADASGVPYTLDNVTMTKHSPGIGDCADIFEPEALVQAAAEGIRLWWPLLYDEPGTTYTLTLHYHTETEHQFPGEAGPSANHTEVWRWEVDSSLQNLPGLVQLLNTLPFGMSYVPLLSDEYLYREIQDDLAEAGQLEAGGDYTGAYQMVMDLITDIDDACIRWTPSVPSPTGYATGIAMTDESPACCYLHGCLERFIGWTAYNSITDACRLAEDGKLVSLSGPYVVTLVDWSWLYMQSPDRSSGIRVIGDTFVPEMSGRMPAGACVGVRGIMDTSGPERVIRSAIWDLLETTGSLPDPLGIVNRAVGGSGDGLLPGFADTFGLWNGGLRVSVAGKVTATGSGFFYLDDGTTREDGSGYSGLRIIVPSSVAIPDSDTFVRVTGVSSWFDQSGSYRPAVLAGTASGDVVVIPHSPN